jgi:hypothetical protein
LPIRGPNQPAASPARKTNPQTNRPAPKQTAIQSKASKPPSDPTVRPARTPPVSPSPPEDEEFQYTQEDIEEPEVPAPPQPKRRRVKIEDDEYGSDIELDEEDEEEDDDEEQDEDKDEEEDRPRTRKKKKKGQEGGRLIPIVIGAVVLVVVFGCMVGGYCFFFL